MEKETDTRYKNTIIYIIEHPEIKDVYINFTTQKLSHRRAKHIDQYKKYINDGIGSNRPEYQFFDKSDFTINLLERINAGSIEEAKAKVHFYRKQHQTQKQLNT